jgi:outer membrane protein OmpA-like peptidoglycan-associated protein
MFVMSIRVSFLVASVIAAATPAAAATGANDGCAPLVAAFDHAVAAKSIDGAIDAVAAIEADIVCGARTDEFRHKLIDSMIGIAGDPQVSDAERKKALAEAQQTIDHAGTWRDAEHLADYYWGRKDNLNAFSWYERGLAFISARPAEHASANDIKQLETRASAAKSLASDDNGGKKPAQFASSRGDMDGRVGGIYSPDLLRGAEVEVVPLPINFVTGEATFTPVGEKAAAELADAVKQQNVHVVTLVGHTDPRGEHQYNVALSIRRAEALRAYLQSHGISAQINVDGKGPDEPFDASLLGRSISQDEEYALDRRVEWVRHSTSE